MTVVKSIHMQKTYQQDDSVIYAIRDCNIEICPGEFVIIRGDKKAGKTTLLHLLGGFERPTDGLLYLKGGNILNYNEEELTIVRRNEVGFLLQNDDLIPELTVHENIIMPALINHKKYDKVYYDDLIRHFHLTDILSKHPRQLDYRQMKYVSLTRALMNQPSLILMDDIQDMIHPHIIKDILNYLLAAVYQCNKTFIVVSNDGELFSYANRIIELRNGSVVEDRKFNNHAYQNTEMVI